jgi:hypothetical protein
MFNVTITYKSGKIENTKIGISQYSQALQQLTKENRMISMEIVGVE